MKAIISGYKYFDEDGNGQRASTLIQGSSPDVVLVLDVSGSTHQPFDGDQIVPDLNGDNLQNTILDAEIAATGELLSYLVNGGFGSSRLGLISFAGDAEIAFDGKAADITGNTYDVYTEASKLQWGGATSYEAALTKAEELINTWNSGPANIIFVSDGRPNLGKEGVSVADRITNNGHNIQAFGVGKNTPVGPLDAIDSDGSAFIFSESDALFQTLNGNLVGGVLNSLSYTESGIEGIEIYVDLNGNGTLDSGEPSTKTDNEGNYKLEADLPTSGPYEIREVEPQGYKQTEGNHYVTFDPNDPKVEGLNFGNTKAEVQIIPEPPAQLPTTDFTPPYETNASADGKEVTITFNEEIQEDSGLILNDRFKIKANNKPVDIAEYVIMPEKRSLSITLERDVSFREKLYLSYKDSTNDQTEGVVQDTAGNDMASFAKRRIENTTGSTTTLEIEEATADNREIELIFTDSLKRTKPRKSSLKVNVEGEANKVKDIIIGGDGMTATLIMKNRIFPGETVSLSYRDKPGDQKRKVFQNEVGNDLESFKNMSVTNGDSETTEAPSLVTAYGRFDEVTLEFNKVLQSGRISPGRFKIFDEVSNYRIRNASIGKNSKEVILDLKDDLPSYSSNLQLNYTDMPGNQTQGVIQSTGGTDVASILGESLLIF